MMGSGGSTSTEASSRYKVWRRDKKDLEAAEVLFQKEMALLKDQGYTKEFMLYHMKIYKKGVWDMRDKMVDIFVDEMVPENEKAGVDPDHWYEINLANCVLFPDLVLEGVDQLLPGRLFTTRMPRNISSSPDSALKFQEKKETFNLHTALILTEKNEYVKYAGADLEAFYKSLGIDVIHRPIVDFTVPEQEDMIKNIKEITLRLASGLNCLVHCAGGSGRTGMVIAAIVKSVGVRDPINWVRKFKSTYVETEEQEEFVNSLPPVLDDQISAMYPTLASVIGLETLLLSQKYHQHVGKGSSVKEVTSIEQLGLTAEQIQDYSAAFEMYCRLGHGHGNEEISKEGLAKVLAKLGSKVSLDKLLTNMDVSGDGKISKFEFILAMSKIDTD